MCFSPSSCRGCATSGAYFVGTFLGKHKLCPTISPKKTVEGLIGGFVVSVLASVLAGWLYQLYLTSQGITAMVSLWQIALIALLLAPLSVAGDLFASIIKRQCHVKDFGSIMPGHGGVMDRFDSVLFVAPVMFILVHYRGDQRITQIAAFLYRPDGYTERVSGKDVYAMTVSPDGKRLVILGSTGSIGVQALQVAERLGYPVTALAAGRQAQPLEAQIRRYRPQAAVLYDEKAAADLKVRVQMRR